MENVYRIIKVPGYSCPDKYLLMKDDVPIIFANGKKRLSLCLQYLHGYKTDIQDKKIKRLLEDIKNGKYINSNI